MISLGWAGRTSARHLIINISPEPQVFPHPSLLPANTSSQWCAINYSVSTKLFKLSFIPWYWIIYSANFSTANVKWKGIFFAGLTAFVYFKRKERRKWSRKRHASFCYYLSARKKFQQLRTMNRNGIRKANHYLAHSTKKYERKNWRECLETMTWHDVNEMDFSSNIVIKVLLREKAVMSLTMFV